jgi:hypothetical protein
VLRDELSAHKAASADAAPSAYLFASAAGTRQDGGRSCPGARQGDQARPTHSSPPRG